MTLILTAISSSYIVQAVDTRFSRKDGWSDDGYTKMVFVNRESLFTYTGTTRLQDVRTARWLADWLSEQKSTENLLPRLAKALENVIRARRHMYPDPPRLGVVCTGWQRSESETPSGLWVPGAGEPRPYYFELSNFMEADGRPKPGNPWVRFRLTQYPIPTGNDGFIQPAGAAVRNETKERLQRRFSGMPPHPGLVAEALVDAVREVATYSPTVSSDVMIASLPREGVATNAGLRTDGVISPDQPSTAFARHDASKFLSMSPVLVEWGSFVQAYASALSEEEIDEWFDRYHPFR